MKIEYNRPSAESILNRIKYSTEESQNIFRVYLGSAPGTGKTYMMLEDGNYLRENGIDVVIGYIETHGRKETADEIKKLEVVPRKKILYKGSEFEELDADAVIARKPAIALIDELAHNNIPGSKNLKRYQDAIEIYKSGISVFTTLNIFHLNSIAEKVEAELRVKVSERVPDYILNYVTEIINVDIPAGELINRLKAGKIYSKDKIPVALENFFKLENLLVLRELALRTIADELSTQSTEIGNPEEKLELKSNERVLVLISSNPDSARLVRIGSKLAGRLNANLYVLHINLKNRDKNKPENYDQALARNISIAENLGAAVFSFQANDVVSGVIDFVKSNNIAHVVIGATNEKVGFINKLFKKSIVNKLIDSLPDVSFHVVPTASAGV
ncbi:MAG: sensor histidine kinase KdpD [Candidatus Acidulodesulfobacterium ferriphilum]|uniref:Sensor histidine kinase KdpD n=1 Tax=Candidatus Acidulodesulfobacterium ferriphilum TaxID=2597223 RepID=A0A519BAH9_9DELT|nr:MAG: sensor histidine kinase KdpD [Candidatus Acidulodesulfobacterium ferriphilum]